MLFNHEKVLSCNMKSDCLFSQYLDQFIIKKVQLPKINPGKAEPWSANSLEKYVKLLEKNIKDDVYSQHGDDDDDEGLIVFPMVAGNDLSSFNHQTASYFYCDPKNIVNDFKLENGQITPVQGYFGIKSGSYVNYR